MNCKINTHYTSLKNPLFVGVSLLLLFCIKTTVFAQNDQQLFPKVTRMEGQGNGGNWLEISDDARNTIMSGAPWKVQQVEYKYGLSPISVRVYDITHLQDYDYRLKINPVQNSYDTSLVDASAHWTLEWWQWGSLVGSYTSQSTIGEGEEEFIDGHGIAIKVQNSPFIVHDQKLKNTVFANPSDYGYPNIAHYAQPDLVGSAVYYGGTHHWLGGVKDVDTDVPANWIRAGQQMATSYWECNSVQPNMAECDYMKWRKEDFFNLYSFSDNYSSMKIRGFMDPLGQYEHIAGGTWAPYMMSSPYNGGPKANYYTPDTDWNNFAPMPNNYDFTYLPSVPNTAGYNQTLTNLYSVDIVLTPDTSLWTRALVLESGSGDAENNYQVTQHFNGQTYYNIRHEPKTCPSVDKNGYPDNSGTTGFGWFPGYAINVETGERLNIMFAENSADEYNHGNDMLFNPTNVYAFKKNVQTGDLALDASGQPIPMSQAEYDSLYLEIYENDYFESNFLGEPLNGGRHYVYICGSSGNSANTYYRYNRQRNYNDNNQTVNAAGTQHGGTFTGTDGVTYPYYECGVYDEGKWLSEKFKTMVTETNFGGNSRKAHKMQIFNNVMWTGIPMPAVGEESHWLEDEAWVMIRVARPYMYYSSAVGTHPEVVTNSNAPAFAFRTLDVHTASVVPLYELDTALVDGNHNRINVNNVDAPVSVSAGSWFFDNYADYKWPKGTNKTSYFSFAFWLGGLDEQDSLHLMAERFKQIGEDSWPGPLSINDATVDNATIKQWNKPFKITRKEVMEFLANYETPDYNIPQSILDWPAHGDTLKGQAWNLAPFVDQNNNNIYEPALGDHPDFPGDMALFIIFNDNYKSHTESQGEPLGTEVHGMVYAYDAPDDSIMNNAIFFNYKFFNRSQHDYHDTYIGLWSDWDLGYAYDDYVASDIMRNTAYCYNGRDIDGSYSYYEEGDTVPSWGIYDQAYGENCPVQTLTLLSGPLMPADGQDNPAYHEGDDCSLFINNGLNEYAINGFGFGDGIVDNERYGLTGFMYHNNNSSVTGDPSDVHNYYNLMSGRWKDDSHLKYGANGHPSNGSSDIDCRFMFPGNQYPCHFNTYGVEIPDSLLYQDGWYEDAVGNAPYDRRGLASVGPFNLEAGSMQEIDFSMITIPHSLTLSRGGVDLSSLQQVNNDYRPQVFVTPIKINMEATICDGETYNFFGETYQEPGIYTHYVRNALKDNTIPDTVYTLNLTKELDYILVYASVKPGQGYQGNGFNITPAQTATAGTYVFTGSSTSPNGCVHSIVLLLDVQVNAGVEQYEPVKSNIKVYPNPTTGYVTVETDDVELLQKHERVMVFDLNGRLLQSILLNDTHTLIDMSAYSSGTYILKVGQNVEKIIKR
jgi:hypothetical protein